MKVILWSLLLLIVTPVFGQQAPRPVGAPFMGSAQSVSAPSFPKGKAPKIYFPQKDFKFGDVDEGPDVNHFFRFRNRGKSTLKITDVRTSCGCTAARVGTAEIPPGGVGSIAVTYHTAGHSGIIDKVITVSSNDPVNPSEAVTIHVNVVKEVDIQPSAVGFYNVRKGESRSVTVNILGKPGSSLKVLSAESTMHVVTVTLAPLAEDGQKRGGAMLAVSLPVTQQIGRLMDSIKVKTSSAKKPELEIQVTGEVIGRVTYNLKEFNFYSRQDAPVTNLLIANPPQGFAIRKVESAKHLARPYIKKYVDVIGNDQNQLIVSPVKNLPKDSDGKDEVIVYTNDPEQEKIVFPVTIAKQ